MIQNHIIYNDFSDYQYTLKKAEGNFVWDSKGRKLIDFTSGWNVTNLGWNHPEVNEAVIRQVKKNVFAPMWSADPVQEEYAAEFAASLPKSLSVFCRATGGTEANEEALKIARAATGRHKIIGFRDTYHGQSFGSLALGARPEWTTDISPMVPEFIQIPYPTMYGGVKSGEDVLADFLTMLEKLLKRRDIAGMVTESGVLTGWGTTEVAPKGYLPAVRKLTKQYGTMLILDEVGTGFGRCGKLFGMELDGVVPDIATFAKGISNGAAPIGACVVRGDIAVTAMNKARLVSTFGWTPLACAAGLATLRVHKREKTWEKAKSNGEYLITALRKNLLSHPRVSDIYGVGMEIGVRFVEDKKSMKLDDAVALKVRDESYKKGLHLAWGGSGNIQIMPPITMDRKTLDDGVRILTDVMSKIS